MCDLVGPNYLLRRDFSLLAVSDRLARELLSHLTYLTGKPPTM